jgi:hypothetical protein
MSELRIVNDKKVDHPRKGSKDLSDAVTGAVYNAIALTPRNLNQEIEIYDYTAISAKNAKEEMEKAKTYPEMPREVASFLDSLGML